MTSLDAINKLLRTEHAVLTYFGVVVGELLVLGTGMFSNWPLLLLGIGPALITAGAFALNDYHGVETDTANNRRDRPIVSGQITRSAALYIAVALMTIGLFLTLLSPLRAFAVAVVLTVLSLAYDPILKKIPLLGNAFIAFTMSAPFVYGALALPVPTIPVSVLLLSAIAFFAGVGREILKTIMDVKGDKLIGAVTLPMLIGSRGAVIISTLFFIVAIVLSLLPVLPHLTPSAFPLVYTIFILAADALFIYSSAKAFKSPDDVQTLQECRNYTLAAMGLGVVAFLALAIS